MAADFPGERFNPCNRSPRNAISFSAERRVFQIMFARSFRSLVVPGFVIAVFLAAIVLTASSVKAAPKQPIPPPAEDLPLAASPGGATAIFAGGCFWGTQSVFERVKGVLDTTAGYAGGSASTATYAQVTTETTGHAESVRVVYDPSKITYGQLLRIFFSVAHDPTELNRQGPDVGTSYRSAIFYENVDQKRIASAYIAQLDQAKVFPRPIVTEVTMLKGFYRAEEYHQDYALHNPDNPYIQVCDRPKIAALKKQFPELFVDYEGKH
jgi:peptide-methionine (S)-S-oxide reductase